MHFQKLRDSDTQNKTSGISKSALSKFLGLRFAEQHVGNLKKCNLCIAAGLGIWRRLALQLPDMRDTGSPTAEYEGYWLSSCQIWGILLQLPGFWGILALQLPDMRDTGSPAAGCKRDTGSPAARYTRDTGSPTARYWGTPSIWCGGIVYVHFFRLIDLSFSSVTFICRILSLYSVILLCHSLLPYLLSFTNVVILCRLLQSCSSVLRICHLHLALAFWTCHLQSFCHCIMSFPCAILLWCAFVVRLAFDMSICTFIM